MFINVMSTGFLKFSTWVLALSFFLSLPGVAQVTDRNPVAWTLQPPSVAVRSGEVADIKVSATIAEKWYIYAPSTPPGGPIKTTIELVPASGLSAGGPLGQPKPGRKKDLGFGIDVDYNKGSNTFILPVKVGAGAQGTLSGSVRIRFQACNDRICLPPKTVTLPFKINLEAGPARAEKLKSTELPVAGTEAANTGATPSAPNTGSEGGAVNKILRQGEQTSSLPAFLALAFISGFAALMTPCVFPMIPITVSLFSKKKEREGDSVLKSLAGPLAYCGGIVGTFTLLGLVVSAVAGASGITQFAAHPLLNLAMAVLFVVLALNLFGVFEIVIPARLLNKVQGKRDNGLWTPLLMGLVFTLTSFTCTVPFVGTALVSAATGGALRPALGMLVFSTAFALPFFLLALFPSMVSRLPKSGDWLVSAKVYLGFLELAAAIKFLQQADYTWQLGWITLPVFLSLWFALALIAAAYLFKILRLPGDFSTASVGPGRRILGAATLGVGGLLLAANNGLSLGYVDSYFPPREYGSAVPVATNWLKDDYDAAIAQAKAANKPLLINFTGYACTNCRYMERNVLPAPAVVKELESFVAVHLHTDGPDAASKRNARLQQEKVGTVALPVYAVLTPDGQVSGTLEGLEGDPTVFAAFLRQAKEATRVAASEP